VAYLAIAHLLAQANQTLPQLQGTFRFLAKQVQHQTKGSLSTDTRQLGEFIDRVGEEKRRVFHRLIDER